MKGLSAEGGRHGITVNAVVPWAWTDSGQGAMTKTAEQSRQPDRHPPAATVEDLYTPEIADPDLVSPAVCWLAHESCEVTGVTLRAGAGYVAEVFMAMAPGYFNRDLSIEAVREHWSSIRDQSGYSVLDTTESAITPILERVARSLGAEADGVPASRS
jgi:hypothetical protein